MTLNLKPVCVVTYNTYTYSLQPITLTGSGRTMKNGQPIMALRQSTQKVSSTDLYDVASVKVQQDMGQGADSFTLEFSNFLGKYTDFFTPFQEIEIRVGFPVDPNSIVKEDLPLIMIGLIDDAQPTYTKGEGWKIEVTGRNYASLLLEAKLTDTYHNMSSSAIVQDIIDEYGLGLQANITQSTINKQYQKVIRTSAQASNAMSGRVQAGANISVGAAAVINKYANKVAETKGYIDDYLFRGHTAWSAIEKLAYYEGTNNPDFDGQEFVAYYTGKVFYFGPRMNIDTDPSMMVNIQVGASVEHYKFRISTDFLHTKVTLATRLKKNRQPTKKVDYVSAPDDLVLDVDATQQELDGFAAAQQMFGIREVVLRDRDKIMGVDPVKAKWIAKAKLKEYSRLVYTGDLSIVFTADLGNSNVSKMTKDRGVAIYGVEAVGGQTVMGQNSPQSRRYNGIFYIDKATHSYTKAGGYKIDLSVSSRTPEMTKAIGETTIDTQNQVIQKNGGKLTAAQLTESKLKTN